MASFNLVPAPRIHPNKIAQVVSLLTKEVEILDKYANFTDVFLKEKTLVLADRTKLNKHTIDLKNDKQPPYRPIYSLGLIELETLKTYIKTHVKTGFIQPSKSPVGTLILFDKKPDKSFHLYIDY